MKKLTGIICFTILILFTGTANAELIITEIMKDPLDYSDSWAEWFEIYNNSPDSVHMEGYTIFDNDWDSHTIGEFSFGPYDVVCLGNYADPVWNGNIGMDYVYNGFWLDNADDEIIIHDDMGNLVDEVWYDDGVLWPDYDGASMMLTDIAQDNNDPAYWRHSTIDWSGGDFGSPRELNEGPYTAPNLVISEIMYDPMASSDSYGEWLEVYNTEVDSVNLRLWYLIDNDGGTYRFTNHVYIQPGEYFVIAQYWDPVWNGNVDEDWQYTGIWLDNTNDGFTIADHLDNTIDAVIYDEGAGWMECYGASLYLEDLEADNNDPVNWARSTEAWFESAGDFGSPGEENQDPYIVPELVITEIMYDPYAASDAYAEWFEVYNPGVDPINFRLWEFVDDGGNYFSPTEALWLQPGEYFIFARYADPVWNGNIEEDYVYTVFYLDDIDDEIAITDLYGNLIDEVNYDEENGWIASYGASIYLNDLEADNNDPANWEMSTVAWEGSMGDFGSPGEENQAGYTIPDVLITEIMYDPHAVADSYGEWFEVYNAGDEPANLRLWKLNDLDWDDHTIPSDLWVQPGEYLLLALFGDPVWNGNIEEDYDYHNFYFDNTADALIITDLRGNQIDIVEYDEEGTFPETFGASIYLTDLEADNNDGTNWDISTWPWPGSFGDFGTPGEANQGAYVPPNIIITEIMIDPHASTDGWGEWVEIYNAEPDSINLRYWDLYDNGNNTHTINQDLWINSEEYLLIAQSADTVWNGNVNPDYVQGWVWFDNDEDELILQDHRHNVIDIVEYDSTFNIHAGCSIYLTDLQSDNNDPANWAISDIQWPGTAGDFGSPGEPNQVPQPTAQIVITEIMINPLVSLESYGEWFELYNAGEEPVNLRYYDFLDNEFNAHTVVTDLIVEPNEYKLLAIYGDPAWNGNIDEDYVYTGITFDNTEDELIIRDMHGAAVDVVFYDDGGDWPLTEGASMYLINPFEDNFVGTSWTTSTELWPGSDGDFGSPGQANFEAYLTLTPIVTEIPEEGGDLVFDTRFISYLPNTYQNVRFWTEVETPDGFFFELTSQQVTVPPYLDITVEDMTQEIPDYAPGGTYTFLAHIGYPNIYLTDSFEFTKLGLEAFGWSREDWEGVFGGYAFTAEELPTVYAMENAYPNPFNPTTNITVSLPEAADLKVLVYNVNGRLVAELADNRYNAGYHHLTFDASLLASGMYFVQAVVPGQLNEVQKVMLVK